MNKNLIRKLAIETDAWCDQNIAYPPHSAEYNSLWEQKFAELIVHECLSCSYVLAKHYIDTHTEKDQTLLLAAVSDYSSEISKMLGVEEVQLVPRKAYNKQDSEPVAWMTFDGEGGYDYRSYEENENYANEWQIRNPNYKGWVTPLYSHPTSETTDQLMAIIDLYEKALLATFPQGASGEAFEYWNEARKALKKING